MASSIGLRPDGQSSLKDSPSVGASSLADELVQLAHLGRFEEVVDLVARWVADDPASAFTDPWVGEWLGRRFRHIFLDECQGDEEALAAARHNRLLGPIGLDARTERRRLADRFLRRFEPGDPYAEMPRAVEPRNLQDTLVFVPGMLTGMLPVLALHSVFPRIEDRFGLRVIQTDTHPVRSSLGNVEDLLAALEQDPPRAFRADGSRADASEPAVTGKVVMVGYSKGLPDITELLVARPDLADRISAVVGWGGAGRGSLVADDLYARLEGVAGSDNSVAVQLRELLGRFVPFARIGPIHRLTERVHQWDLAGCLADATTTVREKWWEEHLEQVDGLQIPFFTVAGSARLIEVPWYQAAGAARLLVEDPINDMQVTEEQSQVPVAMSTHLATVRAHHWDLSYNGFPMWARFGSPGLSNNFAKYPAMSALVLLLHEIGLVN